MKNRKPIQPIPARRAEMRSRYMEKRHEDELLVKQGKFIVDTESDDTTDIDNIYPFYSGNGTGYRYQNKYRMGKRIKSFGRSKLHRSKRFSTIYFGGNITNMARYIHSYYTEHNYFPYLPTNHNQRINRNPYRNRRRLPNTNIELEGGFLGSVYECVRQDDFFNALSARGTDNWRKYLALNVYETLGLEVDSNYAGLSKDESEKTLARFIEFFQLSKTCDLTTKSPRTIDSLLPLLDTPVTGDEITFLKSLSFNIHGQLCDSKKDNGGRRYRLNLLNLYLCSQLWLQSPLTWQGNTLQSLVEHLFAKYNTPSYLEKIWIVNKTPNDYNFGHNETNIKWNLIYIAIAQGLSLKKLSREHSWNLPAKFNHTVFQVPTELSLTEAVIYAEVIRFGGSEVDFKRIISHRAFLRDLTHEQGTVEIDWNDIDSSKYKAFWYSTLRWFIANSKDLPEDKCTPILAWAIHKFTEDNAFSFSGRTLKAVLTTAEQYHELLRKLRYGKFIEWQAQCWDWFCESKGKTWHFVELTNSHDLYEEGSAMHHCVGTYAEYCVRGDSAIFSLKENDKRAVTIDISKTTGRILEAMQRFNVVTTADQQYVIDLWLQEVVTKPKAIDS